MVSLRKCAVIGVGFVGATSAFTLATSGLFSEIVLIDANHKKAEGEAADINHGISFAKPCKVYAGDYKDLKDVGLVVIAAGANQKPNETRIELLDRNLAIFKSIIPQITAVNKECILLVVSNPVDVLTYMALKISGFPSSRVFGSGTVLDTSRLKYLLGNYLQVDSRNIHAFIIGEHGDSELAVFSSANVSGIGLEEYCQATNNDYSLETLDSIYENVRDAAYSIIEGKGATYYAIAMAVKRIAEAIVRHECSVLPVSSFDAGHSGISNVCLALPSSCGFRGVQGILDIPLSDEELDKLQKSSQKLSELLEKVNFD